MPNSRSAPSICLGWTGWTQNSRSVLAKLKLTIMTNRFSDKKTGFGQKLTADSKSAPSICLEWRWWTQNPVENWQKLELTILANRFWDGKTGFGQKLTADSKSAPSICLGCWISLNLLEICKLACNKFGWDPTLMFRHKNVLRVRVNDLHDNALHSNLWRKQGNDGLR